MSDTEKTPDLRILQQKISDGSLRLGIIGLGYVGLPLAVEFGKKFATTGFDIKPRRIEALSAGIDTTLETSPEDLASAVKLTFTDDPDLLKNCDIFIVTVPTPVDKNKRPDLTPLIQASRTVGEALAPGAIVIYESTVFPGCTEEECVPVLEKHSQLKFNRDFFCGYSPERINPGDREHTLTRILKITSGSTDEAAQTVYMLYQSILSNGTFRASSIKVAEAAKVIENSQRDINIAFVNELAKIFHLIGLDTAEVLEAAGTKWNFLKFKPGLVGGHCIGVDPYYLTHKAQELGYLPEVILSGRRINDGMGKYLATEIIKLMIKKEHKILNSKVLQLGITFKENCPDIRNSHAAELAQAMRDFGCIVDIFDPWADAGEVKKAYQLKLLSRLDPGMLNQYDAVVLTVAHRQFCDLELKSKVKTNCVIYDVQGILPRNEVDGRL